MSRTSVDLRALAFTTVLVVATGIFGLLPAIRASAVAQARFAMDPAQPEVNRLAGLLVCGEVGAAVLLLIRAAPRAYMWALNRVDPGFRTTAMVSARISPPEKRYANATTIVPFVDEVLRRVRAIPGVEAADAVDNPPLSRGVRSIAMRIEGQFEDLRASLPMVDHHQTVTPGYFSTMSIPLVPASRSATTIVAARRTSLS